MIVMILTIFLLILFLVIIVPSLFLSIIARIIAFFNFGSKRRNDRSNEREANGAHDAHGYKPKDKKKNHKKIFDKDEGEYVDFEEIK